MLILASASPRRHDLLTWAGIAHLVRPSSIPEHWEPGEPPLQVVQRLSREKALSVACEPGDVVLGADTIVCIDDEILGKPRDTADAARMLRLLSGRQHQVHTGICLRQEGGRLISDVSTTQVWFAKLTEQEISEYTRSGEPAGKAGGYAIQGLASKFVMSLEGSYQNVVGLPVSLVYQNLKELGLKELAL